MLLDGTALPESGSRPRTGGRQSGVSLFLGPDTGPPRLAAALEVWAGALCAQVDPELFFPEKGEPTRDAKAVCAACPVRARGRIRAWRYRRMASKVSFVRGTWCAGPGGLPPVGATVGSESRESGHLPRVRGSEPD